MTVDGTIPSFDGGWLKLAPVFREFEQTLPLVVYYEQNRGRTCWLKLARCLESRLAKTGKTSLHTTVSSPPEFKAWFFEKEADEGIEIRQRQNLAYADPELVVVRNLLKQLDGFTAIRSRKPPDKSERTLFFEKDGANIPFESLSGGEQGFFLLAADCGTTADAGSPIPLHNSGRCAGASCASTKSSSTCIRLGRERS